MSTMIVSQPELLSDTMNQQPVVMITDESLYWDGFNAACEGQPLENMLTLMQQRGWWFALQCEAEAKYAGSIEDDHDFIRHGGA